MGKKQFISISNKSPKEANIYANKSALILDWLLREGKRKKEFSLREVAKETGVSIGLVQRIFVVLGSKGFLGTSGLRTTKRFYLKNPKLLLESWLNNYSIIKKCKMSTYHSALSDKEEILNVLKNSNLSPKVALALHSAAEAFGLKNTNLDTVEIYLLDSSIKTKIENVLKLEPKERGYEILLIEPYYKNLLKKSTESKKGLKISPILLTFLDLFHFPLRGLEQAEFIAERIPELKRIYKFDR